MSHRKEIEEFIKNHQEEMIRDLSALCRIDSVVSDPVPGAPFGEKALEALDFAGELCEKYGITVSDMDHMLKTADLNPEGEPAFDILAHVDVVPGGPGWTVTEPFAPLLQGDRLYGRGTSDDKGGVISCLYAMRAVKELGIPVSKRCRLIIGSAEETGMADAGHYYRKEKPAKLTASPDCVYPVINVEKGHLLHQYDAEFAGAEGEKRLLSLSGGLVVNQVPAFAEAAVCGISEKELLPYAEQTARETGVVFTVAEEKREESVVTSIIAKGHSAHGSIPETGKNAVMALAKLILLLPLSPAENLRLLRNFYQRYPFGDYAGMHAGLAAADEVSGETTCSADILRITETSFHAEVDTRTAVCADTMDFEGILNNNAKEDGLQMSYTMELSHSVPEESEGVQTLLSCYEEATGEKGKGLSMGGLTYVHHVPGGVGFGPLPADLDTNMHGPDEYMPLSWLFRSTLIYALCIERLCR